MAELTQEEKDNQWREKEIARQETLEHIRVDELVDALEVDEQQKKDVQLIEVTATVPHPTDSRVRLPAERPSITVKGTHGEMEFYVVVGFYDPEDLARRADPGEIFVKVAKQGSDTSVFVDGWAIMVSLALQSGIPWSDIQRKFTNYPYPNLLERITECIDTAIATRRQVIGLTEVETT